ncbi:MAG: hypothetical protein QXI12_12450 [Candidatus Methanomethyliaceae archaeon]
MEQKGFRSKTDFVSSWHRVKYDNPCQNKTLGQTQTAFVPETTLSFSSIYPNDYKTRHDGAAKAYNQENQGTFG